MLFAPLGTSVVQHSHALIRRVVLFANVQFTVKSAPFVLSTTPPVAFSEQPENPASHVNETFRKLWAAAPTVIGTVHVVLLPHAIAAESASWAIAKLALGGLRSAVTTSCARQESAASNTNKIKRLSNIRWKFLS